ncbi:hypothetical protein AB6A40_003703 [Gnathostoma spinigerum]|uniref:Sphingomyelin synthase-like domain-containing protein n=1 Tax=Gnathostoma spinigerum TaxID=75299 RepID=A0ABD6EAB6_9BILA
MSHHQIFAMKVNPTKIDNEFNKIFQPSRARALLSFSLLLFAWLANEVAIAWIHDRVPRKDDPLPDLWFSIFPEVPGCIQIAECIILIISVSCIAVMIFHQYRWVVVSRSLFCISLSYLFRAICITVIQVPVPSKTTYCAPQSSGSIELIVGRVLKVAWALGVEQFRPRELCGDLIVSGHTICLFGALLTFRRYIPKSLRVVGKIYHMASFVALACILLARKHYTIDVIFGYMISTRIFWEYHALAESYHKGTFESNPLRNCIWSFIVPHIEENVPPPHYFVNRFEVSFGCPIHLNRRKLSDLKSLA